MKDDKSNRAEDMASLSKVFDKLNLSDAQRDLAMYEITYQDGENPLEIWKAISLCHREKMPYPKWVTGSLALIAINLLSIDTPDKQAPELVYKALGIEGWEFKRDRMADNDIQFCLEIERLRREKIGYGEDRRPRNVTEARRKYAKNKGLSFYTVRDRHKELQKWEDYKRMISYYLREDSEGE